jgi:Protein of unknown function (DUF2442)
MTSSTVTVSDRRRFAAARNRGDQDARAAHAVVRATYLKKGDAIELVFRSGMTLTMPRRQIPVVLDVPQSELASVTVSPAGDALSWRALDIDIDVRGLIRELFPTR